MTRNLFTMQQTYKISDTLWAYNYNKGQETKLSLG